MSKASWVWPLSSVALFSLFAAAAVLAAEAQFRGVRERVPGVNYSRAPATIRPVHPPF
jgi:hypothetical protein